MDCSTPGFPVLHYLPEFAQTHVHWVSDAIQPSQSSVIPFSSCSQSFPLSGSFQMNQFFFISWPKYWSFSFSISPSNEYSGLISFRMDWLDPCSPRDSQESSPTPQFKSINSSALSFMVQLSHPYMTIGKTIALMRQIFVGKVMSLLFICCLGWS